MRKNTFFLVMSLLNLTIGHSVNVTPVYTHEEHDHCECERRYSSSSGSSSSSSGVYGPDTNGYDKTKINTIGERLEKYVKPGDIFVDTVGAIIQIGFIKYQTGHAGIVKSVTYESSGKCVIKTIEALGYDEGIKEVELTAQRVYNGAIYRVEGVTTEQINKAIYFSEKQVGKDYKFKLLKSQRATSINTDSWYCSELVVAAYKYGANVDLSSTDNSGWINPTAIGDNSKTKKVVANETNKNTTVSSINASTHTIKCDGDSIVDSHIDDKKKGTCRICGRSM